MADPYKGEDTQLAVGVEDEQGTAVTPTRTFGKVADDATAPDPEVDWRPTRVIGGGREIFQKHEGQREYQGGDIPVILIDGAPIAYALGDEEFNEDEDLDGSSEDGLNTHVLTAKQDGKPPGQTIEAVYYGRGGGDDFVRTFAGCVPNSLELAVNNDDELTGTLSYWAQSVDTGDSPTGSISVQDRNPWLFADITSRLELFDTEFARFEEFSLSIENNLEEGRYIEPDAGRDPFEITYGNLDLDLSATIGIEDDALYQELLDPTSGGFDAILEFERPNEDKLRIECSGCNFNSAPHDIPAESSVVTVEVDMTPEDVEILVEDSHSTEEYLATA